MAPPLFLYVSNIEVQVRTPVHSLMINGYVGTKLRRQ